MPFQNSRGKNRVCDLGLNSTPSADIDIDKNRGDKMFLLLNGVVQVDESLVAVFCEQMLCNCIRQREM